mmetsp:Transcript_14465/g.22079  ORF Transcript_14465/g.22079 Transcript_14465/m.22079 type:complete len:436 (+) Transcript_14465:79-1386(+)
MQEKQRSRAPLFLFLIALVAIAIYQHSLLLWKTDVTNISDEAAVLPTAHRDADVKKIPKQNFNSVLQQCTTRELDILKVQLPARHCNDTKKFPWLGKCSFSYASRCPTASNWLGEFMDYNEDTTTFLGISIGCNKGYDAVDTLRWGTQNVLTFDTDVFRKAKESFTSSSKEDLRCEKYNMNNDRSAKTKLVPQRIRSGEMHCVEALPSNFKTLQRTAQMLNLTAQGFLIQNVAISDTNQTIMFPKGDEVEGTENLGIEECWEERKRRHCTPMAQLTLDSYVEKYVTSQNNIHHLSIDIEGYDAAALKGGSRVLERTEYLEFEYNWMGSWRSNRLVNIISIMEEKHNFSCYFIGNQELWRITHGCFQEHYNNKFWSNVGCVSIDRAPRLLTKMEEVFQQTLSKNVSDLNYIRMPREAARRRDVMILEIISRGLVDE